MSIAAIAMLQNEIIPCTARELPMVMQEESAATAIAQNPANRPAVESMSMINLVLPPQHLAVLTTRYWGNGGVKLTVGFMESIQDDLASRLLTHFNAWGKFCNVSFNRTKTDPQVRITRNQQGYWSYLGTDILHIPKNSPTMCLSGFTMQTPESEFIRVVRHEVGHTLGYPHEHMRRQIIDQIDPQKAIAYFWRTQGWNATQVYQQVLTPLEESSIMGTQSADESSIMTYQLPGSITKDGQPILGGVDFSNQDKEFSVKIYPLTNTPQPPDPPTKPIDPPTPTDPNEGGKMNLLLQLILNMLKKQLETWMKDGTLEKFLEDLLNRFKANKPTTIGELQIHAMQALEVVAK